MIFKLLYITFLLLWEISNIYLLTLSLKHQYLATTIFIWTVANVSLFFITDTLHGLILLYLMISISTIILCTPIINTNMLLIIWQYIHLFLSFLFLSILVIYIIYKFIKKNLKNKYIEVKNDEIIIPITTESDMEDVDF